MAQYSLADLTRITGAKRRSVQLWAEAGVIKAFRETERAGTGTHRRFSRDEAIVACIVHAFARQQISIGQLLKVADAVRFLLSSSGLLKYQIERAISDEKEEREHLLALTTCEGASAYRADLFMAPRLDDEAIGAVGFAGKGFFDALKSPNAYTVLISLNTWLAGLR